MKDLELFIERLLFATRWLLAPIYLGLSLAVLALGVKFFQELLHIFTRIIAIGESDLVLAILCSSTWPSWCRPCCWRCWTR